MRDPDAGRLLFSDLNALPTRLTLTGIVQNVQRTMAECTQFLCAGRAEFPEILQIFRPIFAQILRDLDAGLALYLAFERTQTRKKGGDHAGRVCVYIKLSARGAPKFFGHFPHEFGAKVA